MPVPLSVDRNDSLTATSEPTCWPLRIASVGPLTDGRVVSDATVRVTGAVRVRSLARHRMVTVPLHGLASAAAVSVSRAVMFARPGNWSRSHDAVTPAG